MTTPRPCALMAEDEQLLAESLQRELKELWPELHTLHAQDGLQAVSMALGHLPDILFLDVRMPGCTGLEAAQDIADQWPSGRTLPVIVFVTAFDHYAVQAFEQAALDYLVKPVKAERLAACIQRIQARVQSSFFEQNEPSTAIKPAQSATELIVNSADDQLLHSLRQIIHSTPHSASQPPTPRLQRIQASVGNQIVFVPMEDVLCFEAADKYVRVLTSSLGGASARELLIRTPIKDLLSQLDPDEFWQIHRSTLVRASSIEAVQRDELGKLSLQLRGLSERLVVSRLYAHLFRAM